MEKIYCVDISKLDDVPNYKNFPIIRKNYIEKISDKNKKIQCVVAWHLLSYALENEFSGMDFEFKLDNGRFYIENPNINFSISHSKNLVFVLLSDKPCGIDVQYIDDKILLLKEKPILKEICVNNFEGFSEMQLLTTKWTVYECNFKAQRKLKTQSHLLNDELNNEYVLSYTSSGYQVINYININELLKGDTIL